MRFEFGGRCLDAVFLAPLRVAAAGALLLPWLAQAAESPGPANATPSLTPGPVGRAEHDQAVETPGRVVVWIQLSLPPLAAAGSDDASVLQQHKVAVEAQQTATLERLASIDGTMKGRVTIARNAIAAEVPRGSVDGIRNWPGVVAVTAVTHRNSVHGKSASHPVR